MNIPCVLYSFFILYAHLTCAESFIPYAQKHICQIPSSVKPLFVPQDPVKKILLGLIESEQKSIVGCAYVLTDRDIAEALIAAQKRGVKLELVLDITAFGDRFSKVDELLRNKIKIYKFSRGQGLLHNKFLCFGLNIMNKQLVWTGSANFTTAGLTKNEENVLIIDDMLTWKKFTATFETIKKEALQMLFYTSSTPLGKKKQKQSVTKLFKMLFNVLK